MNWGFFEILGLIGDVLNAFGSNSSSSDLNYNEQSKVKKKTKYLTEKVSAAFLLISAFLLFFVFKDPLPAENYVQTLLVTSLIGLAISLLLFFLLYILEFYYFRNVFQWLFFSLSTILVFISAVLYIYFDSGMFI
ncbi:MAG: branched-chain amino acid ABC transporter substrate-binding protein [Candidatus Chryseobacterium colombiense]|nr:branched-chain amino acid ABC transporter substrate-binding protein [Chryseobacterium sp.]WEK69987.1 MAG: branched-chain amino acid ABC transporter substrate-binding protein [Chryseobacterium sp.]